MKLTPRIAAIIAALLLATPAYAVMQPEKPVEKPEPPKPEPKQREKPKPEPRANVERERSECPYTRLAENDWKCVATVRPRARPVTDQTVPSGELK